MKSEDLLKAALDKTGLPVKYLEYEGIKPEYIVYNEEVEEPTNYGDNTPLDQITWWQVHIFAPRASDFRPHKEKAKAELLAAGFTITDIVTLLEGTSTIHVVISCHIEERED